MIEYVSTTKANYWTDVLICTYMVCCNVVSMSSISFRSPSVSLNSALSRVGLMIDCATLLWKECLKMLSPLQEHLLAVEQDLKASSQTENICGERVICSVFHLPRTETLCSSVGGICNVWLLLLGLGYPHVA